MCCWSDEYRDSSDAGCLVGEAAGLKAGLRVVQVSLESEEEPPYSETFSFEPYLTLLIILHQADISNKLFWCLC